MTFLYLFRFSLRLYGDSVSTLYYQLEVHFFFLSAVFEDLLHFDVIDFLGVLTTEVVTQFVAFYFLYSYLLFRYLLRFFQYQVEGVPYRGVHGKDLPRVRDLIGYLFFGPYGNSSGL